MNAGALLYRHRRRIMGYAALMIIVYHCFFDMQSAVGSFITGKNNKIGVDIFVFLSGFGLSMSLSKSAAFVPYYKRRLRRILPSYYVVLACMMPFMSLSFKQLMIAVIPVSVWAGNETLWYVSASLGYYLLVPVLFRFFTKARYPRTAMCLTVAVFALAVPAALSFMEAEIALMRIPALVTGAAFGVFYLRHQDAQDRVRDMAMLAIMAGVGLIIGFTGMNFGLLSKREVSFLAKNLCAPAFAVLLAMLFDVIERSPAKICVAALDELGKYSLELYFAHLVIKVVIGKIFTPSPLLLFILLVLTSYPMARAIHFAGRVVLNVFDSAVGRITRKTS